MLDEDGNIREVELHENHIMDEHESSYLEVPTVKSINACIDYLMNGPDEDKTKLNQICCSSVEFEAQDIAHKLEM